MISSNSAPSVLVRSITDAMRNDRDIRSIANARHLCVSGRLDKQRIPIMYFATGPRSLEYCTDLPREVIIDISEMRYPAPSDPLEEQSIDRTKVGKRYI